MMILGHLLVAVTGGVGAAVASLAAGQSPWMAALLYVAGGNAGLGLSVAAQLLRHQMAHEEAASRATAAVR
ncbi:hypothetical protein [Rubellimicrobium arenae]|uniref:hypothetical protein n=1 Tax=Rubellimicrobium arenae TaxID=2817372 RepID=UPI001B30E273|nr:hypothetical protein [Rubellimicrobium arenae]